MSLSTHVLDTTRGEPAAGVPVRWERLDDDRWSTAAEGVTDADGRLTLSTAPLTVGRHRLVFDTAARHGPGCFFPEVTIVFAVTDPDRHLHVPLLTSPYGHTTYRGS